MARRQMTGRRAIRCVLALLLLVQVPLAAAQFPGGGAGGGSSGGRGGTGGGRPPGAQARDGTAPRVPDAAELLQIQLSEMEEDLKLAPSQRKDWIVYSDRVKQLAADIVRTRNALRFPKGAAPQQLDALSDVLRNRQTAFEDIVDAGKAFYATLSPEQREIADRRLARVAVALVDVSPATALGGPPGGQFPGGGAPGGGRGGGG
jgi:hypothetical protein